MNTNRFKILLIGVLFLLTNCKPEELLKVTKLQTGVITEITYNSAKASGTFIDLSGNVTEYGHCWNTSGNPVINDSKFVVSGTAKKGEYNSNLTNLNGSTKYFVRAYAKDGVEVVYGNEVNFTTDLLPSITITSPTETDHWIGGEEYLITWTSVNVDGNININLYKSGIFETTLFSSIACSLGQKSWIVPNNQLYRKDYTIRIISTNNATIYGESPAFACSEKNASIGTLSFVAFEYDLIKIDRQWWFADNLKSGHYNDNNPIPEVTDGTQWTNLTSAAYSIYNNNYSNRSTYGCLYNWYAVNTGMLCPVGWHVARDEDWTTLEIYLQNHGYNFDGTIDTDNDRSTNNYIAKSLAATTNWNTSSSAGVPGNTDYSGYRNKSGFTSIPGGYRFTDGTFQTIGNFSFLWSASEASTGKAWSRYLFFDDVAIGRSEGNIKSGYSVRCVKN